MNLLYLSTLTYKEIAEARIILSHNFIIFKVKVHSI